MARKLDVTITYLEQQGRPRMAPVARPPGKVAVMRVEAPTLSFYRYLYRLVGDPHHWVSRRRLGDAELQAIIGDERVHVLALYVGGVPGGMAEFDFRDVTAAELKFFGLAPDFQGRGYGRYFLAHAIDYAWSLAPARLRLETCTLDHPAALPLYQKLGFSVFDQKSGEVELIDD